MKIYVAVSSSSFAGYSEDGITWTETYLTGGKWRSVCYGDRKFVAIAESSKYVVYCEDGIIWTETTLPDSANWYSV